MAAVPRAARDPLSSPPAAMRRPASVPVWNAVLSALFAVVIALPLAANLAGFDGADAAAENRELARFPRLTMSWSAIREFLPDVSLWFDDHFGFRSRFVRWYGESRLFGLGVSPSASVVKGHDGWFFYADDMAIEDYTNVEALTPEAQANWRQAVVRARDWLRARGVGYVFVVAPDKHVIYGEEMPSTLARIGDISRTDQLYTTLQDTGFAVDMRPWLFDAKTRERIYHQTDTHWNDRGALVAYQRIIEAVRARVPSTPPPWTRKDFEPVERTVEGLDLAAMMGLKRVLRETDLALQPRRPRRARVVEPAGAAAMDELGRLVTEVDDPALPRAVILRDSFVSRLVPFLSEHFSRAVFVWQNDFDANLVEQEHPDVVIQEIVGRHLYNFIPSPELVPAP
jgi:alginate O-acetyltransferase complex protein AlgJ